jgi:hypothetical protein
VHLPTTSLGVLDTATTYSGNTNDYVYVWDRSVSADLDVPAIDVPYRMDGTHIISSGTVTIAPGTVMAFTGQSGIEVDTDEAALAAVGTSGERISFTGVNEVAGYWQGILFDSSSVLNELTYCDVAYGGSAEWLETDTKANVSLNTGAALELHNCNITHSGGYGGYAEEGVSANINFTANFYSDNDGGSNNYGE